jgi:hypothetical protein
MSMAALRKRPAFALLEDHYREVKHLHLRQLFAEDPKRAQRLAAERAGLQLDYSKNRVTDATLQLRHQPAVIALSRRPLPTFDRGKYASAAGPPRGWPVSYRDSVLPPQVTPCIAIEQGPSWAGTAISARRAGDWHEYFWRFGTVEGVAAHIRV